jgi:hypothetical protein
LENRYWKLDVKDECVFITFSELKQEITDGVRKSAIDLWHQLEIFNTWERNSSFEIINVGIAFYK